MVKKINKMKKVKEAKKAKIPVIKACIILNGVCEGPADEIAALVWAFSSKEKRDDALRGILRGLLNEAEPENHWCEYDDLADNIDDVLDELIEEGKEYGDVYVYDGLEQTFRVEYAEIEIDGYKDECYDAR